MATALYTDLEQKKDIQKYDDASIQKVRTIVNVNLPRYVVYMCGVHANKSCKPRAKWNVQVGVTSAE